MIQKSRNISVTYNTVDNSDNIYPFFHNREFSILDSFYKIFNDKYDTFNVIAVMPDGQKSFIEKIEFNTSYVIARCNDEWTDCYIFNKYRMNERKESDACFYFITRLGHKELVTDLFNFTDIFLDNPENCLKKVN